jgi:hypothetical protein
MFPFFSFFCQIIIILLTVGALFAALQQYYFAPHPKKRIFFGVVVLTFCCALAVFGLIPLTTRLVSFKKSTLFFTYEPWLLASGISCLTLPSIRERRSRYTTVAAYIATAIAIIDLFANLINV